MINVQFAARIIQVILLTTFFLSSMEMEAQSNSVTNKTQIINGLDHTDTQGNPINAHGGGFLKVGKYYYLIGENRRNDVLVSCYRSKDLINWEFRGNLLTKQSNSELANANIERPKVIYNEKTKQFVMWMHYEIKSDYSYARAAVATSSDIEKPFNYLRSFRPLNNMSRDCNLFKDSNGKAYFISSSRENADMIIYELSNDYLSISQKIATLWPDQYREAPAIVKHGNYYFILTSHCTGWDPNQAKYAFSKSMSGPWSNLRNIGSPMTFDTQPTYILPIKGKETTSYLYVGDRWDPSQYHNSKYIYLPLTFSNDTTMQMEWVNNLSPNLATGRFTCVKEKPIQYRIKSKWTGLYMGMLPKPDSMNVQISNFKLAYAQPNLRWEIETLSDDYIRIKHVISGKYITADENNRTMLRYKTDSNRQLWKVVSQVDNWCKLVNKETLKALIIERSNNKSEEQLFTTDYEKKYDPSYDKQGFLLAPIFE